MEVKEIRLKEDLMGLIANKYASRIYVTDDNPRNENPANIRKTILKYCLTVLKYQIEKKQL